MVSVRLSHLFWPPDRKLFRRQSRWRSAAPAIAAMLVAVLAVAVGQVSWR